MGWQHAVAGGQGNLVAASLQSPNFIHGVSGWQVTRAGDLEANSATIRGVIIGGQLFLYSGTPGLGNAPIISLTTAAADPFGNAVKPDITVYGTNGSAVQLKPGPSAITNYYTGDAAESVPSFIGTNIAGSGATRRLQTVLESAFLAGEAAGAGGFVEVSSPSADLTTSAPGADIRASDGTNESFVAVTPTSASIRGQLFFPTPTNDATGAGDSAAISGILNAGWSVQLLPGSTYYLKAPLTVPAGGYLDLGGATVQPGSAWSTPPPVAMITLASGSALKNGTLYGGTNARSSNPATDAITLAAGATRVRVEGITCNYMNGFVFNATVTAAAHCSVAHVIGTNNAGGIKLTAASTGISAQYNISDVNLQQCETSESLYLQHVFDVLVGRFNSSVFGSAGVPTVHLLGKCTTCYLTQMDCGVSGTATAGIAVLLLEDNSSASVTDCRVSDSIFQAGGIGIAVNGGTARCQFTAVAAKGNAGDGWQFNGTGTGLAVNGCYGNTNLGAGDVNVTSTAHVGLDLFCYASTGTTNSLAVPVTNHVTNANPTSPGGRAGSGTPAGW